ncbi:MAG: ATP-binding protein [Acidimicrobiales bacterium]
MRATTRLEGAPTSAREARRFVNEVLHRARLDGIDDVVVLLANELVTNAILHARSDIELAVELVSGGVRVEVCDTSPRPLHPRRVAEPLSMSGRGLELVAALAASWGVDPLPEGKRVWFEVSL